MAQMQGAAFNILLTYSMCLETHLSCEESPRLRLLQQYIILSNFHFEKRTA